MQGDSHFFDQRVSEADIDWIICVELNANSRFREWMCSRVFGQAREIVHLGAWRSIETLLGESDLLWLVKLDGAQHLTLIENKINAPCQPSQQERYRQRAAAYINEGICGDFRIVLAAPEGYRSADCDDYDVRISYESVGEWFAADSSERGQYLCKIFASATRSRRELAPPDAAVTQFRQEIWKLAAREFPALEWPNPGSVSATMYWVEVNYSGFWLKYKMYKRNGVFGRCVVDLELPGRAGEVDTLQQQNAGELTRLGATVVKADNSAAIRIEVPRVAPPLFEETAVRAALRAAESLLRWWRSTPTASS